MFVGILLWLLGCSGCGEPVPTRPAARAGAEKDVVLVLLDGVRADHLSLYGYERSTSPKLDAWAADAVVFEAAYATAAWARPSVASLLVSVLPQGHGLHRAGDTQTPGLPALPWVLKRAGYKTTAIFSTGAMAPAKNPFLRGFDTIDATALKLKGPPNKRITGKLVTNRAITAWQAHKETKQAEPFFLLVEYSDPLPDLAKHKEHGFGESRSDRYDSELAYTDAQLARLLEAIGDDAIVVITSPHGTALGEHELNGFGKSAYQPEVRVPLLLRMPGVRTDRVNKVVSLIDVAPSLLSITANDPVGGFRGNAWTLDAFGALVVPIGRPAQIDVRSTKSDLRGVVLGDFKLIEDRTTRKPELYDLSVDPGELQNLAADPAHASKLAELRAVLP